MPPFPKMAWYCTLIAMTKTVKCIFYVLYISYHLIIIIIAETNNLTINVFFRCNFVILCKYFFPFLFIYLFIFFFFFGGGGGGGEGGILDLIVLTPDHCLYFYCQVKQTC